jgi:hypothetical protein
MVSGEEPRETTTEADDWFGSSGETGSERPAGAGPEPAWLDDAAAVDESPRAGGLRSLSPRWLAAIAGGAAIVLLLIVLAAAGVFSSGGNTNGSSQQTTGQATTPPPAPPPAATPPPPPAVTLPTGVLKPGASGADVKSLQRALASAGHSPGKVDGVYGPSTEQAVAAFQRSVGLPADGVYGPKTKQALEQQLNSG